MSRKYTWKASEPDVASVKKQWGSAIREQRRALGKSQAWLAQTVGVDQSMVSYWERGLKAPGIERQLLIAKALRVAPRVLFQYPEVA